MRRHQPEQTCLRADENASHRPKWRNSVEAQAESKPRRPQPSKKRVEYPAPIVIRQPAPGLRADKRPAEGWIHEPTATREGRPAEPHSVQTPAISVAADRVPRALGIEVRYRCAVV